MVPFLSFKTTAISLKFNPVLNTLFLYLSISIHFTSCTFFSWPFSCESLCIYILILKCIPLSFLLFDRFKTRKIHFIFYSFISISIHKNSATHYTFAWRKVYAWHKEIYITLMIFFSFLCFWLFAEHKQMYWKDDMKKNNNL